MTRKKRARRKPRKLDVPRLNTPNKEARYYAALNSFAGGISFYLRYEPARTRKAWRVPAGYYDYRIVARKRSQLRSGAW